MDNILALHMLGGDQTSDLMACQSAISCDSGASCRSDVSCDSNQSTKS